MNKVIKLGMAFNEGEVPDFGSIQQKPSNTNILYLLAEDIPKLNGMLTRAAAQSYIPEGESFDFHTGTLAFVVDFKTAGSGEIYAYHRGQDQWYEFNIRSDLGLWDFIWNRHSGILRETKEISGIPPLTFDSNGKPLKNYRIYGNTVNGNSVGDKTANIFAPENILAGQAFLNSRITKLNNRCIIYAPATQGMTYTLVLQNPVAQIESALTIDEPQENTSFVINNSTTWINHGQNISTASRNNNNAEANYIAFQIRNVDEAATAMIVSGSTPPENYEPYGYKISVVINNLTTPIYLPVPLRKSGIEPDYIDYKTQTLHRERYNLISNVYEFLTGGTSTSVSDLYTKVFTGLKPNTSYVLASNVPFRENQNYLYVGNTKNYQTVYNGHTATFNSDTNGQFTYMYATRSQYNELLQGNYWVMLVEGSTPPANFEPYIQNTDISITLPTLNTEKGTNNISINSTVNPLSVDIKYNDES